MTLDEAIFYALESSSTVHAISADRAFPVHAQQDTALPYVVWQRISTTPLNTHDGPAELEDSLVQVTCYGATYTSAYDLRKAVRAIMENTPLANGARGIVQDVRESSEQVGATEVFRADVDITFMCDPNDATPSIAYTPPTNPGQPG